MAPVFLSRVQGNVHDRGVEGDGRLHLTGTSRPEPPCYIATQENLLDLPVLPLKRPMTAIAKTVPHEQVFQLRLRQLPVGRKRVKNLMQRLSHAAVFVAAVILTPVALE